MRLARFMALLRTVVNDNETANPCKLRDMLAKLIKLTHLLYAIVLLILVSIKRVK